ncbi:WxL domain-containing protein [Macrococcus brunensis]|uniref:WxL domain-containing protein n=1 Tax=Macrococcus brunensis TaxID=198483 RepID=UPI001EF04B0A|nr:WxL domain-containing protein [Macrococcus brunensis]ULG72713.1 WxL domain-containing protein [Macrococcus brunensis]ULG74962.1 WxL domain-containing protein [Macrococcus brunensis]
MKTNKILATTLIAGLAVAPFVSTSAFAADSTAKVTFTAPTDTVTPKLPTAPGTNNPDAPTQGTVNTVGGPLTLDFVSNIEFGTHAINPATTVYQSTTLQPYIQVSDRRGTGEGWNVTAQASAFTDGSASTLPGSTITLNNGAEASTSSTPAPLPNASIVLPTAGAAAPVVNAAAKTADLKTAQGLGTWLTSWISSNATNEKVTLTVPEAAATPGTHTSTITWTLSASPAQ